MRGGDHGRRPDGGGRVRSAVLRALVPLAFAGLMWWLGHTVPAAVLVVLAVVLLTIGLTAPTLAHRIDRFVEHVGVAAANGLAVVLGALAWALLVLPIWALSWLVKYSPLENGWATATTNWVRIGEDRTRTPDGRPVRPNRMGARDPSRSAPVRRRAALRYLVVLPVLAIAVLLAMPTIIERFDLPGPRIGEADLRQAQPGVKADIPDVDVTWVGLPVDEYAHEDEPWAKDFFRELIGAGVYHDYILGQRLRDFTGEHLNIVDGRRVTYLPADPELTVWFFGGSTMYGIGQRDDHTIPSVIARLAEADGIKIEAINFGVSGDANWPETIRFAQALVDMPLPDLVVFYDGANEMGVSSQRLEEGSTDPNTLGRYGVSDLERELHRDSMDGEVPEPGTPERGKLQVELAAAQYRRGVELSRRLGDHHDIPVMHFWQPQAFAKVPSPADEELWRRVQFPEEELGTTRRLYAQARERSGMDPIDISDALDSTDRAVYFDSSHTNELGARIVAEVMYEYLRPQLEAISTSNG
ncbi:MAG: SGNH/GDSL hydrolase family protein [Microthrixaceae bacterium]